MARDQRHVVKENVDMSPSGDRGFWASMLIMYVSSCDFV